MTLMDDIEELIQKQKANKRELNVEVEVIKGKLIAVGEFITDLEILRDRIKEEKQEARK